MKIKWYAITWPFEPLGQSTVMLQHFFNVHLMFITFQLIWNVVKIACCHNVFSTSIWRSLLSSEMKCRQNNIKLQCFFNVHLFVHLLQIDKTSMKGDFFCTLILGLVFFVIILCYKGLIFKAKIFRFAML